MFGFDLPPVLPPILEEHHWQGQSQNWDHSSNFGPVLSGTSEQQGVHPGVLNELSNLQEQVRELRQAVLEFEGTMSKKLDSMESSVTAAQRYVNNLVPWSMEVYETQAKVMDMLSEAQLDRKNGKAVAEKHD
ncbi:hypothetical protein K491DRAFT_723306 [Lophiostoma macrostomum CBS 122681]|uniref:Uncharacterized protein n=1 Tax=Lophiostoma macrostomum CBS 122681 TaxID=1314788 RepID=A0A6A6SKV7_9PLEO|nr:hypothetical protein K491DRAFT_723306 [Lophiostoma macrostomum CBS 122681]